MAAACNVYRRRGERSNERVITVGIGWVLLELAGSYWQVLLAGLVAI